MELVNKKSGIFFSFIALLTVFLLPTPRSFSTAPVNTLYPVKASPLNYVFKSGDNGYDCFRIPALIRTQRGTILAFAEGRKNGCGDAGNINLVMRRSDNGGNSWDKLRVVWNDSANTCGNPVPLEDITNGKVWLICSWNSGSDNEKQIRNKSSRLGRRVFSLYSTDDGKTWSVPKEITGQVKLPGWTWYATGPCHGIQILHGRYKGRLIVPVNYIEASTGKNFAMVIYSDDHGNNWKIGGSTPRSGVNESTVTEIKRGMLMINMRNSKGGPEARQVAISKDGGKIWSHMHEDTSLIEPKCQGSLLSYKFAGKTCLLFCNPSSQKSRSNLTLKLSKNGGRSWPYQTVIYCGPSAYSDITINDKKQVVCLYEAGLTSPYEGIACKTIYLKQLIKLKKISIY